MERQCKALALGEFTFKTKWDHFRQLMDPIWQQWGTPTLNMCTHVQYTLQARRATEVLPDSVFLCLSLHLQYVSKAWKTLDCAWLICFLIHLNFLSLFPSLSHQ